MARRRKLEAPSPADLDKLEQEFRRETPGPLSTPAPIAQVAADAASQTVLDPAAKAQQEQDKTDAATLKAAQDDGRMIVKIPLAQIDTTAVTRDRVDLDVAEFEELKASVEVSGLRLPVEVYPLPAKDGTPRFALISGYRRLLAFQDLARVYSEAFQDIPALVRPVADAAKAFASMVEENEIRANLSHFERGRIAVLAAQQGAFANTEAAVDALFMAASKAKRSKIRSFAMIFESLGDLLTYPKSLREKDGLQIANALRLGGERRLRQVLDDQLPESADEERVMLLEAAVALTTTDAPQPRVGRPKKQQRQPGWLDDQTVLLNSGIELQHAFDKDGHMIRVKGQQIDEILMKEVLAYIKHMLEKP